MTILFVKPYILLTVSPSFDLFRGKVAVGWIRRSAAFHLNLEQLEIRLCRFSGLNRLNRQINAF